MTAVADEKAGYCNNCRAGTHALCASDKCACPDARRHRQRPSFGGRAASVAAMAAPIPIDRKRGEAPPPKPDGPTFRLVKKDPPAPPEKPKKLTLADRLQLLLEGIEDGDWYSVAETSTARGAGQLRSRCAKAAGGEWEFKAGGVEVFVRRAGADG
jgi:hypothetical protein